MDTELEETPDIDSQDVKPTGGKLKVKSVVNKWDPENLDEITVTTKRERKVINFFKSPWDVFRK